MSEKIVQFSEEIIKSQIKELVRGSTSSTDMKTKPPHEFLLLTYKEKSGNFCTVFYGILK